MQTVDTNQLKKQNTRSQDEVEELKEQLDLMKTENENMKTINHQLTLQNGKLEEIVEQPIMIPGTTEVISFNLILLLCNFV